MKFIPYSEYLYDDSEEATNLATFISTKITTFASILGDASDIEEATISTDRATNRITCMVVYDTIMRLP